MTTLLKVLNNLADIKSAGGVALRVRTQGTASSLLETYLIPQEASSFKSLTKIFTMSLNYLMSFSDPTTALV
jgi:hypothetical protein